MRKVFLSLLSSLIVPFMALHAATTIEVNGNVISNGEEFQQPFCVDAPISFIADGDCIDSIKWVFGDGTSELSSATPDFQVQHAYTTTNWYPIEAHIYNCGETTSEEYTFSIRVIRPDTVIADAQKVCFSIDEYNANKAQCDELIANGSIDTEQANCWSTVYEYHTIYGVETVEQLDPLTGMNSVEGYNGKTYYADADVEDTTYNEYGCYHIRRYHVTVISCLEIELLYPYEEAPYHTCAGQDMEVMYTKHKGTIESARFTVAEVLDEAIPFDNTLTTGKIELPIHKISKAGKYHGVFAIEDRYCDSIFLELDFDIYYPETIFKYKFNNVLAVYKRDYNGGYEFKAYQWYLNGRAIEGATESVYYHEKPFSIGDEVYVELTEKATGLKLP